MRYFVEETDFGYYVIKMKANKRRSKYLYLLDFALDGRSLWISEKYIEHPRRVYNFVPSSDIEGVIKLVRDANKLDLYIPPQL